MNQIFILFQPLHTFMTGEFHDIISAFIADDCHQNLTATFNLQFITSPQWPDTYPFNLSCVWVIRGIPNYRIRVNFTHIDLESHVDFVEVTIHTIIPKTKL